MTEHKHAEILRAIADGTSLNDFEYNICDIWVDATYGMHHIFDGFGEFRLKPVPKPDVVKLAQVYLDENFFVQMAHNKHNVEFTFTADGVLKSARLL